MVELSLSVVCLANVSTNCLIARSCCVKTLLSPFIVGWVVMTPGRQNGEINVVLCIFGTEVITCLGRGFSNNNSLAQLKQAHPARTHMTRSSLHALATPIVAADSLFMIV